MNCPDCGTRFLVGVKYCANCGTNVSAYKVSNANEPLPAGTLIGTYRIVAFLSEGGMGRVYVAEHTKLGRRVAIKMLRNELASNPIAVARFFAEARTVNQISHENIVEITDFLENPGGDNCYIMELLKGEDLATRLSRDPVPPLARTLGIALQIASALTAVHGAGIIHRDLKPENIFLIERGGNSDFVKILDFGVAKLTDQTIAMGSTGVGQVVGTPEYMSPEQACGQPVDHRTDIYALGVILYQMMAGRLPFPAKTFGELLVQHMTGTLEMPAAQPGIPPSIKTLRDGLLRDLLAKHAVERPQTMAEVEARLALILDEMDLPPAPRRTAMGSDPMAPLRKQTPPHVASETKPAAPGVPRAATQPGVERTATPPDLRLARVALERRHTPVSGTRIPTMSHAVVEKNVAIDRRSESVDHRRVTLDGAAKPELAATPVAKPDLPLAPLVSPLAVSFKPNRTGEETALPSATPTTATVAVQPRRKKLVMIGAACGVAVLAVIVVMMTRSPTDAPRPSTPTTAAPATITVRFASAPSHATVRIAGTKEVLGTTPFTASFPRGDRTVTFEFAKPGHMEVAEQARLDADGAVAVALPAIPEAVGTLPTTTGTTTATTEPGKPGGKKKPPAGKGSGSAATGSGTAATSAGSGKAPAGSGSALPF